jgi:DNA-binding CsgD family transcriptional regulator
MPAAAPPERPAPSPGTTDRLHDVRTSVRAGRVHEALASLARLRSEGTDGPAGGSPDRHERPERREHAELVALTVECLLARGDVAAAATWADQVDELVVGSGAALALHARGELASARDDHETALELHLAAGVAACSPEDDRVPWRLGAALSMVRCARGAEAGRLAHAEHAAAVARGDAHDTAHALRVLATVAADGRSVERLEEARALLDDGSRRLAAQVDTDLAGLLVLAGESGRATALLREVERYAVEEDLWPLQSRARRLLQRIGETPLRLESEALVALTAAERRVAVLALDGLPNRAIAERLMVSVKAVEGHLSKIYRKLGVSSRGALIATVGRHR